MSEVFVSLARKWRPRLLSDMVGQTYVVRALQNAMRQSRLHHAFLFTGTRGVGKTTLARIVAMLANCEQRAAEEGEPCLQCPSCLAAIDGRLTDIIELDAASHTQVDKMRELLESVAYAPVLAKYKIYIIDEAHMLSKSAFNAMLKTLEEPPPHVKFILATTDAQKLPATVRSRCLCFSLLPLTKEQIRRRLAEILQAEKVDFEEAATAEVARLASGSLRDALSILDQAIAHAAGKLHAEDVRRISGDVGWEALGDILRAVAEKDAAQIRALTDKTAADNINFDTVLSRLAALIYKTALFAAAPSAAPEDEEEAALAADMAKRLSGEELQVLYEIALRGRQQLPLAPDVETGFEMTLLRMMLFAPTSAAAEAEAAAGGATSPPAGTAKAAAADAKKPVAQPPAAVQPTSTDAENPPDTAKPPEAAKPSPPTNGAEPSGSDWQQLTTRLSEVARALTRNCVAEEHTAAGVTLRLDRSRAKSIDKLLPVLQAELRELCGAGFTVRVITGEDDAAATARREGAEQAARNTPFAKQLLAAAPSARLVQESVRRNGAGG